MKAILQLLDYRQKSNSVLILFCTYCLFLLLIRAKLTNSIFLFFLIWNLFLAAIPYAISLHFNIRKSKLSKIVLVLGWLLFLPNSFYIVTDIIHLSKSSASLIWLDLVILISFAVVGFTMGLLSLFKFESLVDDYYRKLVPILIPMICFLCGFGIYLGRIHRYNSWDVISDPFALCFDLFALFFEFKVLLFSFNFGFFIYLFYSIRKYLHFSSNN